MFVLKFISAKGSKMEKVVVHFHLGYVNFGGLCKY